MFEGGIGIEAHLPIGLALVNQGEAAKNFDLRDLAHLHGLFAELHHIQGIVVAGEICGMTTKAGGVHPPIQWAMSRQSQQKTEHQQPQQLKRD